MPDPWRALLTTRGLLVNLFVLAAFGILVPWKRGIDFFDPLIIFSYSAIALLYAASTITSLLNAHHDPQRSLLPPILASAQLGWITLFVVDLAGIATVNLAYRVPRFLHPNAGLLATSLLFGFTGALFLAAFGAMLSVVFSPSAARSTIRLLFALVLMAGYFEPNYLPASWQHAVNHQLTAAGLTRIALIGSAVAILLAAGLLFALRRPTPRT